MRYLERLKTYYEMAAVFTISLLFAASFGWNYGISNHVLYLLSALRIVNPGLLQKDWFATNTTHYHVAFKYVAAGLIALSPQGYAIGVMQTLVIASGMIALYLLVRELGERKSALPAFAVLAIIVSLTRTVGPNVSYIYDQILQPSGMSATGFLFSVLFFVRGQWLASGIALAVCGIFHANYLIIFFGGYTLAHLMLGFKGLKERMVKQMLPSVFVLLLLAPMILATAGAKDALAAQAIYTKLRAPHHYVVAGHEREYLAFFGWTLLGLGAAGPFARNGKSPTGRLSVLVFALLVIALGGQAVAVVLQISQATQLYTWRILPHIEILFAALVSVAVVRSIVEPSSSRRYNANSLGLLSAGFGLLWLWCGPTQRPMAALLFVLLASALLSRGIFELVARFASEQAKQKARSSWQSSGPLVLGGFALVIAVLVSWPLVTDFRAKSNVFRGLHRDEQALYDWMHANVPVDSVLLTPPENENMRFHGQRAIVVDWKSCPIVPGELFEWVKRMEDVLGKPIRGHNDLADYGNLNETRLARLKERYKVEFVVMRRGKAPALGEHKVAYSNAAFIVYDVRE